MMTRHDVAIVGGGIVGLATAWQLTERYPRLRVLVLEKEAEVGEHQTGHNSGVLHSGIYYKPGSLRAVNCRAGKLAMEEFCREHGVPMRLANLALEEITEALGRGWGDRDSSSFMLLEAERAGVTIAVPRERIQQILAEDAR